MYNNENSFRKIEVTGRLGNRNHKEIRFGLKLKASCGLDKNCVLNSIINSYEGLR